MDATIEEHLARRAGFVLRELGPVFDGLPNDREFFIAGGAIAGHISDIDIFPVGDDDLSQWMTLDAAKYPIISRTKNATTYRCEPWPVQLCHYAHPTLRGLVDSFDYAHIQAGARCNIACALEVYWTEAFVDSRALSLSWFTGSEYPLSSLIRAGKYYKRGEMPRGSYLRAVLDCAGAVAKRGFKDYADFKDQLDAVDLGLVPEELGDVERAGLIELFESLRRDDGAGCPLSP